MMSEPLVSVIMPVYNASRYVLFAVESILCQTFTDFEFIIINDGSNDNSESILEECRRLDSRIHFISRANIGLSGTLNEGISYARGKYIARMDADDIALPERFAKQVEFLERNSSYVAVGSRVLLIDPEGLPIGFLSKHEDHEEIDRGHMESNVNASLIVHPTVMLRQVAVKKVGGYRGEMEPAEDLDLFLRLAEIGRIANLKDTLLKYRMHPKSIGNSKRIEQRKAAVIAVQDAYRRRGLTMSNRGLTMLNEVSVDDFNQTSASELHRKWAWWALKAGNVATARKHAFLALKKSPFSTLNWRVMACAMRGY